VYSIGKQRLFYISKVSGNNIVETEIINPGLNKSPRFPMVYFEDNIYYFDIHFKTRGSYVFRIYENNVLVHKDILKVSSGKYVVYPETESIIW